MTLTSIFWCRTTKLARMAGYTGMIYRHIDEDMKIEVQMKLVDALQNKWRKLI